MECSGLKRPAAECGALGMGAPRTRAIGRLLAVLALVTTASVASAEDAATDPAAARQAELDALTHSIDVTAQRQTELRKEIADLDKDRATLNQSLIDTGKRVQDLE